MPGPLPAPSRPSPGTQLFDRLRVSAPQDSSFGMVPESLWLCDQVTQLLGSTAYDPSPHQEGCWPTWPRSPFTSKSPKPVVSLGSAAQRHRVGTKGFISPQFPKTEPLPHPHAHRRPVVPGRGGRGQQWDRVAQTLTRRTPPPPLPCPTWSLLSLQKERDVTGAGREAQLSQLCPEGPGATSSPSSALGPALGGPPPPRHSRHSQGDSYGQVIIASEQAPWNFIAPFKTQTP